MMDFYIYIKREIQQENENIWTYLVSRNEKWKKKQNNQQKKIKIKLLYNRWDRDKRIS